jgi:putative PIN family toxin of toxin-antitoxin system
MRLVLDTNVVLDWLLFEDSTLQPLSIAVCELRVTLVASAHTLDELRRVLQYPKFEIGEQRQQLIFGRYAEATHASMDCVRLEVTPQGFPRCRDPDDDPFVALAYCAGADALVSKDRQVLKLRKRVAKFGVSVLTPAQLMGAIGGRLMATPLSPD